MSLDARVLDLAVAVVTERAELELLRLRAAEARGVEDTWEETSVQLLEDRRWMVRRMAEMETCLRACEAIIAVMDSTPTCVQPIGK